MLFLLACMSSEPLPDGVPMALQGDWYAADGRLLRVASHSLGDWTAPAGLDGAFANDTFLFESTPVEGRGATGTCSGSLAFEDDGLTVELSGECADLSGRYARTPEGVTEVDTPTAATPTTPAKATTKTAEKPAPTGKVGCERYVECICDTAIEVRHRGGETSYMASCDAARFMADLGTADADCEQALVDMQPWFDGIAAVYPRVEIPSECR